MARSGGTGTLVNIDDLVGCIDSKPSCMLMLTIHEEALSVMQHLTSATLATASTKTADQLATLSFFLHSMTTLNSMANGKAPYHTNFQTGAFKPPGKWADFSIPTVKIGDLKRKAYAASVAAVAADVGEIPANGFDDGDGEASGVAEAKEEVGAIATPRSRYQDAVTLFIEYVPTREGMSKVCPITGDRLLPPDLFSATISNPGFTISGLKMARFYFVFRPGQVEPFKKVMCHLVNSSATAYCPGTDTMDVLLGCIPNKGGRPDPAVFVDLMMRVNSHQKLAQLITMMSFRPPTAGRSFNPTFNPGNASDAVEDYVFNMSLDALRPDRVIAAQASAVCADARSCFQEQFDPKTYGLHVADVDINNTISMQFRWNTCFRVPQRHTAPHEFANCTWVVDPLPNLSWREIMTFMIKCAVDSSDTALAYTLSDIASVSPLLVTGLFILTFAAPRRLLERHQQVFTERESKRIAMEGVKRRALARMREQLGATDAIPAGLAHRTVEEVMDRADDPYPRDDDDHRERSDDDGDEFAYMSLAARRKRTDAETRVHHINATNVAMTGGCAVPRMFQIAHELIRCNGDLTDIVNARIPDVYSPPAKGCATHLLLDKDKCYILDMLRTRQEVAPTRDDNDEDCDNYYGRPRRRQRVIAGDTDETGNEKDGDGDDAAGDMRPPTRPRARTLPIFDAFSEDLSDHAVQEIDAHLSSLTLETNFDQLTSIVCTSTGELFPFPVFTSEQDSIDDNLARANPVLVALAVAVSRALSRINVNTSSLRGLQGMISWDNVGTAEFLRTVVDVRNGGAEHFIPNRPHLDLLAKDAVIHKPNIMEQLRRALILAMKGDQVSALMRYREVTDRQIRATCAAYDDRSVHFVFSEMRQCIISAVKTAVSDRMHARSECGTDQPSRQPILSNKTYMGKLGETLLGPANASILSMWILRAYHEFETVMGFVQDHSLLWLHLTFPLTVMDTDPSALTPNIIVKGKYGGGKSFVQAAATKGIPRALGYRMSYGTAARDTALKNTMTILFRDDVGDGDYGKKHGIATKALAMNKEKASGNVIATSSFHRTDDGRRVLMEHQYAIYEASLAATNNPVEQIMDPALIDRHVVATSGHEAKRRDGKRPSNETDTMTESEASTCVGRMFQLVAQLASVYYTGLRAGLPQPPALAALPLLKRMVAAIEKRGIAVSPRTVKRIFCLAKYYSIMRSVLILLSRQAEFLSTAGTFDTELFLRMMVKITIITEESIRQSVCTHLPHLMDQCRQECVAMLASIMGNTPISKCVAIDPKTNLPIPDYFRVTLPESSPEKNIKEFFLRVYGTMFRRAGDYSVFLDEMTKTRPDPNINWGNANWHPKMRPVMRNDILDGITEARRVVGTIDRVDFPDYMPGNVDEASATIIPMALAAIHTMAAQGRIKESQIAAVYESLSVSYAMMHKGHGMPISNTARPPRVPASAGASASAAEAQAFNVFSAPAAGGGSASRGNVGGEGADNDEGEREFWWSVPQEPTMMIMRHLEDTTGHGTGSGAPHQSHFQRQANAVDISVSIFSNTDNSAQLATKILEETRGFYEDERRIVVPIGEEGAPDRPLIRVVGRNPSAEPPTISRAFADSSSWFRKLSTQADADEAREQPDGCAELDEDQFELDEQECDINPASTTDLLFAFRIAPSQMDKIIPTGCSLELLAYEAASLSMGDQTRDEEGNPIPILSLGGHSFTFADLPNLENILASRVEPGKTVINICTYQRAKVGQQTQRITSTTTFMDFARNGGRPPSSAVPSFATSSPSEIPRAVAQAPRKPVSKTHRMFATPTTITPPASGSAMPRFVRPGSINESPRSTATGGTGVTGATGTSDVSSMLPRPPTTATGHQARKTMTRKEASQFAAIASRQIQTEDLL